MIDVDAALLRVPPAAEAKVICAHCLRWRHPSEMAEVQRLSTGRVRFMCALRVRPNCFQQALGDRMTDRLVPERERRHR
jgi:hypothetical protein